MRHCSPSFLIGLIAGLCLSTSVSWAQDPCLNGDMTARSVRYNRTTLNTAIAQFSAQFKVGGTDVITALTDTIEIAAMRDEMDRLTALGLRPDAIRVRYGLDALRFVAVLQFMQIDVKGSYADPIGPYYLAHKGMLVPISEPDAESFMFNYAVRVKVKRTAAATTWDDIAISGSYPDPRTEWFMFNLKLNTLMAENPDGDHLVLQCISELACYSSLPVLAAKATEGAGNKDRQALIRVFGVGEEYRHMIAWYLLDGTRELLNTGALATPEAPGQYFTNRAVDLGHLCPPRCK